MSHSIHSQEIMYWAQKQNFKVGENLYPHFAQFYLHMPKGFHSLIDFSFAWSGN